MKYVENIRHGVAPQFRYGILLALRPVATLSLIWGVCSWYAPAVLPSPSETFVALRQLTQENEIIGHIIASLSRISIGYLTAVVSALALALISLKVSPLRIAIEGIELLRGVPPLAWLPLVLAIAGMSELGICTLIFLGALFPMLTVSTRTFHNIPREFKIVAYLYGIKGLDYSRQVVLPYSLPALFTGLQISLGMAWMCLVAAELLSTDQGLGFALQLYRQVLRMDAVVACIVVIALGGYGMQYLLRLAEHRLTPWRFLSERPTSGKDYTPQTSYLAEQQAFSKTPLCSSYRDIVTLPIQRSPIVLHDVSFRYRRQIVSNLSLRIVPGERIAIVGESGAGKTTLLKLLFELLTPDSGIISGLPNHNQRSLVTSQAVLLPWLTVLENTLLVNSRTPEAALAILKALNIAELAHRFPHALSAGQYQRACLARALHAKPTLLALDEPTASLDIATRERFQNDLHQMVREANMMLIVVTHDLEEALLLADRILVLKDGHIEAEHLVKRPYASLQRFRMSPEIFRQKEILSDILMERINEKDTTVHAIERDTRL